MFFHYRTQGFFFKKEDRGETNQLFTVFTKDFGKVEILGRAIRKIKSKLRSGADIFYLSEIEFIQGKTQKTLTDAISIEKFANIKKDLEKLRMAYKISEVLDNLIKGQEPDEKIWPLLNEVFEKLNSLEIRNWKLEIIYYYFFWNLFSILGYQPELYHCSFCQKKLIPEKLYFHLTEGGVICQNCFKIIKSGKEIKPEAVKILRVILEKNWSLLSKLKLEKPHLQSLGLISKEYYSYISRQII